ncbi:MAG: response regulator [Rhodobacteraceae bacterium]|nr:response regulator [Paracoccaceae bacterium]
MASRKIRAINIDDDEFLRSILSVALEFDGGFNLSHFSGFDEALPALKKKAFDLVILDVLMPDRNGLEIFRDLRTMSAYADTPVVFLTRIADEEFARSARDEGVAAVIVKPFDPMKIADTLRQAMGQAARRPDRKMKIAS